MENFDEKLEQFVALAKNKGYSRRAAEIILAMLLSNKAEEKGISNVEGMKIAYEYCKKYDDERDCIKALIELTL